MAVRGLTVGADVVWTNGDSMVEDARSLDELFEKRIFAAVVRVATKPKQIRCARPSGPPKSWRRCGERPLHLPGHMVRG